jgi:hypothetical protein
MFDRAPGRLYGGIVTLLEEIDGNPIGVICDLRPQRSAPSVAERLGLEIPSWCDGRDLYVWYQPSEVRCKARAPRIDSPLRRTSRFDPSAGRIGF